MKESRWDVYLLKSDLVDGLRKGGTLLRTLEHDEIVKLKAIGPIVVEASTIYKSRKAFYSILEDQSWFNKNQRSMPFTRLLPYIYSKNKIDERVHKDPDWDGFYQDIKEHEEELVVK